MPSVFITGANRGLGLEFARQYAAAGWRVLAGCRNPDAADALRLPRIEILKLDVTDNRAIGAVAEQLSDEAIDVFIANAGILPVPPQTPLSEISEAAWLNSFRTNSMAPLMCANALLPHVARSKERKMLALGSRIGSISSNTVGGHYVYRASKAALHANWRSFALDHPEIIAAVLSPGPLRTDMTRHDTARWSHLEEPPEVIAKLRALIAGLKSADSGKFLHFTGEEVPW
jgi:NAD(P)-dependent dehydrogenase (short-subunit alcohol dehydrogenase family)